MLPILKNVTEIVLFFLDPLSGQCYSVVFCTGNLDTVCLDMCSMEKQTLKLYTIATYLKCQHKY